MTYQETELSKHDARPTELFKFEGTYENFYYTSGPVPVTFQTHLYIPQPLRRSEIKTGSQNDDNLEVTIEMPVSMDIIAIYGFQISPPKLKLTIYRFHDIAEPIQYWSGPVENIQVSKGTATIRVPSEVASALTADFPNVYFQSPCNNVLYDERCKVSYNANSQATVVSAIDKTLVEVATIGTLDGKLIGGEALLVSGERRTIVGQTGKVLTLNYPFSFAQVTDGVVIAAGCDLAWAGDCKTKFDNQLNHTGFNFIPSENVFQDGLEPGQDVADLSCPAPVFEGWTWEWMFVSRQNNGGATPDLQIYNVSTPGYEINNNTPVGGVLFSKTTTQENGASIVRLRMVSYPPDEVTYSVLWFPAGYPPPATHTLFARTWKSPPSQVAFAAPPGNGQPGTDSFYLGDL